jgi:hypothetical protein
MMSSKKAMEMETLGKMILIIFVLLLLLVGIVMFLGPKFSVVWEKIASVLTGG